MTDHLPAWKRATSGELRWPVSVVVVLTALVQLTVPTAFTAGRPVDRRA